MKIVDSVRRSGRNLRSAKGRTILTALAIAVGAFTLALTLAAGNGLRKYTDDLIKNNFDPAELIVGRDPEVSNNGQPSSNPKEFDDSVSSLTVGANSTLQVKQVTDADVAALRKEPFVEQVRENFQLSIRYVTREGQKKYTAGGEAYNPAQRPELTAGQLPSSGDIKNNTILLPDVYISNLGFKDAQDAIGKQVQVNVQQALSQASVQALATGGAAVTPESLASLKPQDKILTFTVTAVTKRSSASFAVGVPPLRFSETDARAIYDYTTQGTANFGKYLYVNVRVVDGTDEARLTAAQDELEKQGYYTQSVKDVQKSVTTFVNVLQIMVGVFGVITIIASIFGIVNTQYISVLERTREIGLMKALGMSRRAISRLFIYEATWIGFLGGLIGAALAIIAGILLNPVIGKHLDLGNGNKLLVFAWWQLIILIIILMIVAAVAGWLPARKAAKLDPIEALRTE